MPLPDHDALPARFRRSSFCGMGNCVEVALLADNNIAVRDTKDDRPDAPVLTFDREEWDAFLLGVGAGEFTRGALMEQD